MKHLVLRCSDKNRKSYGDFQWPESGPVEAPDWDPKPSCGGGLHGWLCGEGHAHDSHYHKRWDAIWQVVEIEEYISLGSKVKFPRGNVIYSGDRDTAVKMIQERYPTASVIEDSCFAVSNE